MTMFACYCSEVHDSAVQGYCARLHSFAVDVIDACDVEAKHLRAQLAALTAERDAAIREADRWRHGVPIEGDYICPSDLRRNQLHSALSAALRLTYTPECSRDERWHEERERLNQVLGGEGR